MRCLPLLSLAIVTLAVPRITLAQDDASSDSAPTSESATPYSESFSSGEVTPAPPPEAEDSNPEKNPDEDPLNDPSNDSMPENFRIGVTGALEFPHVINYALDSLMFQKYGLSINRGSLSRNVNGIEVSMVHTDVRFRYHPWGGSFFGGIALGQHIITGEKSRDITTTYNGASKSVNATVKVTAKSNYVTPHIGWFTIWEPGFTMGLDLGWLFPVSPKTAIDDSYTGLPAGGEETFRATPEYAKLKSDIDDTVQSYAKKSLPFVTMIRIGWMF